MYEYEIDTFAGLERYRIYHPESGNSFTVIPEHGGHLQEVLLRGVSVIDGFQTEEELQTNFKSKSALLYPFPNRLKNGTYEHAGQTYQFPINSQSTGNAIHGMGRRVAMNVHSVELGENEADMHLRYEYTGDNPAYPFAFAFSLSYYFRVDGKFDVSLSLHNFSNVNIPVGLGWHPYFHLGDAVGELEMQIPPVQRIEVDEYMIPTGNKVAYEDFHRLTSIGDTKLDTGFYITEQGPRAEVILRKGKQQLRYWQETGQGKYNFIQIFTPPSRKSIALEPMTCNIDAFNNGDGLLVLQSGQGVMGKCGFYLEEV